MNQSGYSIHLTIGDYLLGLLVIIVIAAIIFFNTAKGKGLLGEWRVRIKLRRVLGKDAVIFNNYICVDENYNNILEPSLKKTIQIDHIVVGAFGVLVVETKNYSGEIYGHISDNKWTQVLKDGKVLIQIDNPIMQNMTHCCRVKEIVGSNVPIRSIVVFIKNNADNTVCNGEIVNFNSLEEHLCQLPTDLLTKDRIAEISDKLRSADQSGTISSRKHVKNLKRVREFAEIGLCPLCGHELVRREVGQYNAFWECSNWPKCKYKKKQ